MDGPVGEEENYILMTLSLITQNQNYLLHIMLMSSYQTQPAQYF